MSQIDLNSMNLDQLKQLLRDIDKAIFGFEDRRRSEARAALEAQARELGYSLGELTGGKAPRRVYPPKYRDPENPQLTWSGRGRRPEWVKERLDSGMTLDDCLIG